jgi:hypothetical protein
MRLLFIPARGTGRFQINDTHLHRPLKAAIHRAVNEWRISMVMQFRSDMEAAIQSGKNSDQEGRLYQGRVSSLMLRTSCGCMLPNGSGKASSGSWRSEENNGWKMTE